MAVVTSVAMEGGSQRCREMGRCGTKNHYRRWRVLRWKVVTGVELEMAESEF